MILVLPAAFVAIYAYCSKKADGRAEMLARSIILFELMVLIITNLLSVTHLLTRIGVFSLWLAVIAAFAFLYGKSGGSLSFKASALFPRCEEKEDQSSAISKWLIGFMLILMGILAVVLLFGAIFTVPYNFDSMTYHLSRIAYWMDHKSVAHYVCNIDRQIYSPVLAEYNLLQIMILSGNDTFVNFLQYLSMFAATYFIYKTARRLGTNQVFSVFAALIFMFMPLTVSQSVTTQNDLFVTVFFAIFVYELVGVIKWEQIVLDRQQVMVIVELGLTVAYAYLAKTSVCASMVFFMPWLLVVRLSKKDKWANLFKSVGIAIVSIVTPISETLIRTYLSAGSIMTNTASGDIMVATKNVKYILVNILKNFSLLITQHLYRPLNGFVYRLAIGLGRVLNVEVNNIAISFHGFDFLKLMNMGDDMYSHDKTPSAFVAYLAVFGGVLLVILSIRLLINRKKKEQEVIDEWKLSLGFAVSAWLSMGFIMALLRWQPWGTRLMYPALSVTVIMSANMLYVFLKNIKENIVGIVIALLTILCVIMAIPSVSYNLSDAVSFAKGGCKNRINYYFKYNHREDAYRELITRAKDENVKDVGLIIYGDGYDYPLWLLFKENYKDAKLRHIVVEEANAPDAVAPEAILFVERDEHEAGETYQYGGKTYVCTYCSSNRQDSYFSCK